MPLEVFLPQIDNRSFENLVKEARSRIPRYMPEWTDLNDNDPGIALVQLFAWLTELLMFRLGEVPQLNYIKFLQLIGLELETAQAAQAEIIFPLNDDFTSTWTTVPARTQVSADSPTGGPPIVFETERALKAIKAGLTVVLTSDGPNYSNVTDANTIKPESSDLPGSGYQPFGPVASVGRTLWLGFDASAKFPKIDLDLCVVAQAASSDMVSCDLPATPVYPSARLVWEYWDGTNWSPLDLLKDETNGFARSGHIYVQTPPESPRPGQQPMTPRTVDGSANLYWIRVRVISSPEKSPWIRSVMTNSVSAIEGQTVLDEILGGANGAPNQADLAVANVPVEPGSLQLEIEEQGNGWKAWTVVDDLYASGAHDKHYILNRATGVIRFGDGVNGEIPPINIDNTTANVIARSYRFGGGQRGNLGPGKIKTMLSTVDGVDDARVLNPSRAYGGREEESLGDAVKRAPRSLKSRCRAVTNEDFEFLATEAANVKRAHALPLFHPRFPDVPVPGAMTVIIVPDAGDDPKPEPTEGTLRTVCEYLNQRRLLTTELFVIKPDYQQVSVNVEVIATNSADLKQVKEAVKETLLEYFHPLKGGEDGKGWPFGREIYYSLVYQRIFSITGGGVLRIEHLTIELDGASFSECTDIPIRKAALVYSISHDINVHYDYGDA
jgi:predicted phage baseplate assembly protein